VLLSAMLSVLLLLLSAMLLLLLLLSAMLWLLLLSAFCCCRLSMAVAVGVARCLLSVGFLPPVLESHLATSNVCCMLLLCPSYKH
jgi:hypothetical protein